MPIMLIVSVLSTHSLWAQPTPPDNPQAPIDGGLALLLGAGVATAAIRYKLGKNEGKG